MTKEKRILSYFISWLVIGFIIIFMGVNNVFAEEITPTTGFRTQVGSINVSNSDIAWNTSNIGQYNSPLYFTQGQEYYNFFTPEYIRLAVITDLDSRYNYKLSYRMNIYELNVSDWKVSDIDRNYNLLVNDDIAIIKESKCSVVSTNIVNGTNGTTVEKDITCTFSLNYSTSNAWINAGYNCKDCTLSGIENLGTVSSESYMYVTNPKLERFEDNSGVIIDQNQTIIDQNNKTNEELVNIKDQIQESNKETQEVIKDQFNDCRNSYNLLKLPIQTQSSLGVNKNINISSILLNGTTSSDGYLLSDASLGIFKAGTYTFKNTISSGSYTVNGKAIAIYLRKSGSNIITFATNENTFESAKTFTLTEDTELFMRIYINGSGIKFDNLNLKMQIVEGNTSKEWEPYGEEICTNKLDEQNETSKGIWATIKNLPNAFLDMLLGLFIPKDLSFIDNFKNVISNKLGFIASVPIQIIDFTLGLANVAFEQITTISFPSISIFGFNFWNAEEIDITILLEKLKPFKYFTDFTCVILCCRTLYDFYHRFTGGDTN